jgi:hypothetical protein
MKIVVLAKRRPEVEVETIRPHIKEEIEAVWGLYAQGVVREFYARADQGGPAVLTVESETVEQAQQALAALPLVKLGLLDLDLIPLAPFTGLAQLFANSHEHSRS